MESLKHDVVGGKVPIEQPPIGQPLSPERRRTIQLLLGLCASAALGCVGGCSKRDGEPSPQSGSKLSSNVGVKDGDPGLFSVDKSVSLDPEIAALEKLDAGTFLNDCKRLFSPRECPQILSNLKNFKRQAEVLSGVKGREFLEGKKELTLLYPGSGTHLSPLELVYHLANQNPGISKYTLIYTEVDPTAYAMIPQYLGKIVDSKEEFDELWLSLEGAKFSKGKQRLMEFKCKTEDGRTVRITLQFEFDRSDGDRWMRSEHLEAADIVIAHDMTEGSESPADAVEIILSEMQNTANPEKPRIFSVEYRQEHGYRPMQDEYLGELMGVVHAPYGCGYNHPDWKTRVETGATYNKSALFLFDGEFLAGVSEAPGGTKVLADMLTFNKRSESGSLYASFDANQRFKDYIEERRDGAILTMREASGVLKQIKDPAAKKKFAEVFIGYFSGMFNFEAFDDGECMDGIHEASLLAVDKFRNFDFKKEAEGVLDPTKYFEHTPLSENVYSLLIIFTVAVRREDVRLFKAVADITEGNLSKIEPTDIENMLFFSQLPSKHGTPAMDPSLLFDYKAKGLFDEHSQIRQLGFEKAVHDSVMTKFLTFLYIARELNKRASEFGQAGLSCPSIGKFGEFFGSGGFEPGTYGGEIADVCGKAQ